MDDQVLKAARRKAESAVAEMAEGELKTKAFEVILGHLLLAGRDRQPDLKVSPRAPRTVGPVPKSCAARILMLKTEGFFVSQRAIGEVKEELARHGWHYPQTTLSGKLQTLVRRRELRRMKAGDGKRTVWKYTEP